MLKLRQAVFLLLLVLSLVTLLAFFPQIVPADVEWKIIKDLDLKATALDMAPSVDGKWLFILAPGEILIFSTQDGTVADRIPVDKDFDRIASLPRPDMFTIASSVKKSLQVILFQSIYRIDVTGLPFKGPQDAPVNLVVFDDYQ